MSNDLYEFQGKTKEKLASHERRISNLENMNETLIRLVSSVERQTEMNKEQQEQIREQQQVLVKVNENLTGLNSRMETLDQRVEQLENSDSERHIDLGKLFKHVLWVTLPSIIGTYLLIKFGLK